MAALYANDPDAMKAMDVYVQALAAFASDLALIHLPFGGISLVGGVARHAAPWLETFGFSRYFHQKGRFSEFVAGFGVDVVIDDYAALYGCAYYILDQSKKSDASSEY